MRNAEEGILLMDVGTDVSHGYTSSVGYAIGPFETLYSTRLGRGVASFMVSTLSEPHFIFAEPFVV